MATLVLGAAGAAIGGSIGGAILGVSAATIGGFIGSTIRSVVDSWIILSLAPTQRIEGARLDTLRITSATEGAVIPRLYGRMRMGGNIIWATDFREETRTTTQGGGGGKVKTTESLLRVLRRGALRRPDHRHRPHLGRRQADGSLRRHLALVSRRRGADRRSVHRREDGRPARRPIAAPPILLPGADAFWTRRTASFWAGGPRRLTADHHALCASGQRSGLETLDPNHRCPSHSSGNPASRSSGCSYAGLPPVQDRFHDLRRQQGQPEDCAHVGRRDALCPTETLQRRVHAVFQNLSPPERPRQRLDHCGRGAHPAVYDAPCPLTVRKRHTARAYCSGAVVMPSCAWPSSRPSATSGSTAASASVT